MMMYFKCKSRTIVARRDVFNWFILFKLFGPWS